MTFNWLSNLKFAAQPRRRAPRNRLAAVESLQSRILKSATSRALSNEAAHQDDSESFAITARNSSLRVSAIEPGHHFSATVLDGNLIVSVDGQKEFETQAQDVSLIKFTGSAGDDSFDGSQAADHIRFRLDGMAGNDLLTGGASRDTINGGLGDDVIFGGAGNDKLRGGAGDDVIDGGAGRDRVFGGSGNDSLNGGAGADRLHGGQDNDVLIDDSRTEASGESTLNRLIGGQGDDVLASNGEKDRLRGGSGVDDLTSDDNARHLRLTDSDTTLTADDPAILDEVLRKLSGNSVEQSSDDSSAPQISIDVTITDSDGNEISRVAKGQEFQIHVSARDLRTDVVKPGVFSAYFDLAYETEFIDVLSVQHHSELRASGEIQDGTGLIDEAGAINSAFLNDDPAVAGAPFRILTLKAVATEVTGLDQRLTLQVRPADLPFNNVTALGEGKIATDITAETLFGRAKLSVVDAVEPAPPISIDTRILNNATSTNSEGIVDSLPGNTETLDESATFSVEFYGSLPPGTTNGPESFFFNIPYDSALLKLAGPVEIGPSFEAIGDGPVDNQAGRISGVAGKLSAADLESGELVLLARARFQVRPEVGIRADAAVNGSAPQVSFAPVAVDFRTTDGTPTEVNVGTSAEVRILPIAFDLNDDGAISFDDLARVLVHNSGIEVSSNRGELQLLDFNQDEIVDRRDIDLILDHFLTRNSGIRNSNATTKARIATSTDARQDAASRQEGNIGASQLLDKAFVDLSDLAVSELTEI